MFHMHRVSLQEPSAEYSKNGNLAISLGLKLPSLDQRDHEY